jgi:hypothetical protein
MIPDAGRPSGFSGQHFLSRPRQKMLAAWWMRERIRGKFAFSSF